jgi:multidrug efflux pump subunit AcrB
LKEISGVTVSLGNGYPRFLLTYTPENPSSGYAQFFVQVKDYRSIDTLIPKIQKKFEELFPDGTVGVKKFIMGPGDGGKIQLRIMGPDLAGLRALAEKVKPIMKKDGGLITIRDEWRNKVKVVRPQFSENQAQRTGITRAQLSADLEASFSGKKTGVFRDRDLLIPIIARAPAEERNSLGGMNDLLVYSPVTNRMIPMSQIVSDFKTEYEDPIIWRRNRTRMLRIHADPKTELASDVLTRIKPLIEKELNVDVAIVTGKKITGDPFANFTSETLPIEFMRQMPLKDNPSYSLGWDGEAENSAKGNAAISASLPLFGTLMVAVVICLFNAVLQPLIIWLTVPLAIIGVTIGLLLCHGAFGFMALLGLLSLSGMLIKNAIVLIDETDFQIRNGKGKYQAIVDAGVSRLRPVMMAASTTILGMLPLVKDAFFFDMAITIMFGLGFATMLTLIFVPVLYSIFFRVPVSAE